MDRVAFIASLTASIFMFIAAATTTFFIGAVIIWGVKDFLDMHTYVIAVGGLIGCPAAVFAAVLYVVSEAADKEAGRRFHER